MRQRPRARENSEPLSVSSGTFHGSAVLLDLGIDKKPEPESLKGVINEPNSTIQETELQNVAVNEEEVAPEKQGRLVPNTVLDPAFALPWVADQALLQDAR